MQQISVIILTIKNDFFIQISQKIEKTTLSLRIKNLFGTNWGPKVNKKPLKLTF